MISICLAAFICISSLSFVSFAQGDESEKGYICQTFKDYEPELEQLFSNSSNLGYWYMIDAIKQKSTSYWAIDAASDIVGEYPDQQKYAEILANMIMMQQGELAKQIEEQNQFDDLKDGKDYAMDIADIATGFIGGAKLLKKVSPIIDAVTGNLNVIIKNIELARYYEISIQHYSQTQEFLEAISKYAENKQLREVAATLQKANESLLEKRLEYLIDASDTLIAFEAKFFIENLSFELLKEARLYKTNETVKWFVDCGETLKESVLSALSAGKFAFKMGMLVGDIGFGTTNTFNRYQEMKTLSDIAGAIVKANNKIKVSVKEQSDKLYEAVHQKCNYYKMLLTVHARGEYLIYQLLKNDAGGLSQVRGIFDYYKEPQLTTERWYYGQIDVLMDYYEIVNEILVVLSAEQIETGIESGENPSVEINQDAFEIYEKAVEKTMESGSWTEDTKIIADMFIEYGTAKSKTKVSLNSHMNISDYYADNLSNVSMSGFADMSVMGQSYSWNILYEKGVAHYQYIEPKQMSQTIKMEPSCFNVQIFTKEMLLDAAVLGDKLKFVISGDKMTEAGISAVQMLNGFEDLAYGDIDAEITISEEGTLDTIIMIFPASVIYQGYDAEIDYEITFIFTKEEK